MCRENTANLPAMFVGVILHTAYISLTHQVRESLTVELSVTGPISDNQLSHSAAYVSFRAECLTAQCLYG